jgi:hypothetical protein
MCLALPATSNLHTERGPGCLLRYLWLHLHLCHLDEGCLTRPKYPLPVWLRRVESVSISFGHYPSAVPVYHPEYVCGEGALSKVTTRFVLGFDAFPCYFTAVCSWASHRTLKLPFK